MVVVLMKIQDELTISVTKELVWYLVFHAVYTMQSITLFLLILAFLSDLFFPKDNALVT